MEIGTVIDVHGDTVTVQMTRADACSRCGACKIFGGNALQIEAINTAGAQLHDKVRISLESGAFVQAVGILYGIPFFAMMLGFFIGTRVGEMLGFAEYSALTGFTSGIFLAYLCYRLIKSTDSKRKKKERRQAIAVEVVKN